MHRPSCSERQKRHEENSKSPMDYSAPPSCAPAGRPLTEEEMDTASGEIIINFLNSDEVTEAEKCLADLNSPSRLSGFVRNAVDATLEGLLLLNLHAEGTLPARQYLKV